MAGPKRCAEHVYYGAESRMQDLGELLARMFGDLPKQVASPIGTAIYQIPLLTHVRRPPKWQRTTVTLQSQALTAQFQ